MMAALMFSGVAAALVWLAGRRDAARDPRLTGMVLALLVVFPLLVAWMPKLGVLPASSPHSGGTGLGWKDVVIWIWAAGFVLALLRLAFAARVFSRWRAASVWVGRHGGVEIRRLDRLRSPVAAGVIRPVVLVPAGWDEWPASVRKIVIDHELAHLHRRDPLWRWLAELACAVHWFNPLVWWIARRLVIQCEFACDARVLENGAAPDAYARLLCDLAEHTSLRSPALAMAERSSLEVRVRRLKTPAKPRGAAGLFLIIGLTLASAAALSMMGSESRGDEVFSPEELRIRWSADPFPGERNPDL